MKNRVQLFFLATVFVFQSTTLAESCIYSNDFETVVGAEWSHNLRSTTPVGNRTFLGEFNPEVVNLTLTDLPAHSELTLSFDLFILRSWDGFDTDIMNLTVKDGQQLLNASFNNHREGSLHGPSGQTYPNNMPGPIHPSFTGATEVFTLGYTHPSESSKRRVGSILYPPI